MDIEFNGENVRLIIKASNRQSIRLQVTEQGEIDLRVPASQTKQAVLAFLKQHEHWLSERLQKAKEQQAIRQEGVHILGSYHGYSGQNVKRLSIENGQIIVPVHWSHSDRSHFLEAHLRQESKRLFQSMIEQWWPYFADRGHRMPTLRVKKMKTRWGSLSTKGYINLNLYLMAAPVELVELVVVHELCHLEHFDHGAGFKSLMTQLLPDWRTRDAELKRMGMRIGF